MRRSAIAEIRDGLCFDGVGRLLSSVNAWHTVGHYLCKLTPDGERADLVATILARLESSNERYWIGCLQGVLQALADDEQIGRAHVGTPVTNATIVCRLLLEQKKNN